MIDDRQVSVAKFGPVVVVLLTIVAGITAAVVLGGGATVSFTLMALFLPMLGLSLLYQAAFMVRNPSLAVEHDVKPPSKHGPSEIRDERHAKRQAVFAAFGGIFGLLLGAGAVYVTMSVAL